MNAMRLPENLGNAFPQSYNTRTEMARAEAFLRQYAEWQVENIPLHPPTPFFAPGKLLSAAEILKQALAADAEARKEPEPSEREKVLRRQLREAEEDLQALYSKVICPPDLIDVVGERAMVRAAERVALEEKTR